jgi:hypothetical protein
LAGQLTEDELGDVEKEFDELFHVELPEAPNEELEAFKETAGLPVKSGNNLIVFGF